MLNKTELNSLSPEQIARRIEARVTARLEMKKDKIETENKLKSKLNQLNGKDSVDLQIEKELGL